MEKIECSEDKSLGQLQYQDIVQHNGCNLLKMLQALRQALLDSKRENKELAAENAALKEQVAEITALKNQAAVHSALNSQLILEKVAVLKDNKSLKDQAAENASVSAEQARVKMKLAVENVSLKKNLDGTVNHLYKTRDQLAYMLAVVDTGKSREGELEKEVKHLQLQHAKNRKVEKQLKEKFEALQSFCDEQLSSKLLEVEDSIQENKALIHRMKVTLKCKQAFRKAKREKKKLKMRENKEQMEKKGTEWRKIFTFLFPCLRFSTILPPPPILTDQSFGLEP